MLLDLGSVLVPCLLCTGRAVLGTLAHTYLTFGSINLWVMLTKPGELKDHVLLLQTCDSKDSMLCMCAVAQDQVYN